ncbi:translation initiation factor IF-2 [Xylocopilactobacillus apicola]|uniref:translation initiation factor IF-2 n=1 Tax=Xylocopilactobacillus apicola TaxID=2932184 RepID=UPI003CE5626A
MRIYEIAKELGKPSKELVEKAKSLDIDVKSHMSVISEDDANKLKQSVNNNSFQKMRNSKPADIKGSEPNNDVGKTEGKNKASKAKIKISVRAIRKPNQVPQNNNKNRNKNDSKNGQRKNNNKQANVAFDAKARADSLKRRQNQELYEKTFEQNLNPQQNVVKSVKHRNQPAVVKKQENKEIKKSVPENSVKKTYTEQNKRVETNKTDKSNQPKYKQNSTLSRKEFTKPDLKKENQSGEFWKKKNNTKKKNSSSENAYNKRPDRKGRKQKNKARTNVVVTARKERPLPEILQYTEGMNAQDLGKILHREPTEIVKKLFMLGIMTNQNQSLEDDTIELLATDYGIEAQKVVPEDIGDLDKYFELSDNNQKDLKKRPPVVTIMGHVDHGKTTLLDRLRHTHVTEGEAGGITQHIGAYQVDIEGRLITFLDTPGHEAFTEMRARGADVTDIIILVVAADDGVMPQTIEAINHAKAANVPVIVAVNKIDKPGANPNHVMEQLSEYELIPEDWGGNTIFVNISAKTGQNIDEVLEMVNLQADILELKADPDRLAVGTVIEAKLDKGRGPVATLIVQEGTLHIGDPLVVGNTFGRVRSMTNDRGRRVKLATPSTPVEITGLNSVPDSADKFVVFEDEKTSRQVGEERAKRAELNDRQKAHRVTIDNLFDSMSEGELKEVAVIIKADVQGSVEALRQSLEKIEVKGVRVNVIHSAVGAINESDVSLATAGNAIIIGFNVRPTSQAQQEADSEDVDIRLHSVIYKAIEEIESAMKGMLEPVYQEKVTGTLTVREIFKVSKLGTIGGSLVDRGFIQRDSGVRLIRNGVVIYEGKLASLKHYKDDVKEVKAGEECGIMIENYNDIKVDDQIEAFIMEEIPTV